MKVDTKFNVGDLVQHKMNSNRLDDPAINKIIFYEIREIVVQVCYNDAQTFYACESLIYILCPLRERHGKSERMIGPLERGIPHRDAPRLAEWHKIREDDLISFEKMNVEIKRRIELQQPNAKNSV